MKQFSNEQYKAQSLSSTTFVDNKRYVNCSFEKCNFSKYSFTNCEFEDCIFTSCNFSYAFLALNKGYNSGKFVGCLFITCNLTATSFTFPIVDKCEFRNCTLKETNFDGSRFSDTKFIGELDSCFFRGYAIYAQTFSLFPPVKVNPLKMPNRMINVDFSMAKLKGVTFSHKIELSKCIFPKGEDYVFIADLHKTMVKARQIIKEGWSNESHKETALKLVEGVYYSKQYQEQQSGFIDLVYIKESEVDYGNDVDVELFNLIKSLQ